MAIALLFALGLTVLAEALNKLERTAPCAKGLSSRQRLLAWLKATAWVLLAFAGGGAVVGSFFGEAPPTLRELCLFGGFAVLIVRTRFKEVDMQLTPHFSLSELTRSTTAQRMGVDNTPAAKALEQLKHTARMLEGVRAVLGAPVIVTSGYRGPVVNKAVGGATSSDHLQGKAADIVAPKFGTPYDVAKALVPHLGDLGIGQIIYEVSGNSRWVHVSTRVPEKAVNRVITIVVGKGAQLGIQRV